MLDEFRSILSATGRAQVDRCIDAARLWALDRAAADAVLQAFPEKRSVLRLVVRGDELIKPVPPDMPQSIVPDSFSQPVFDDEGRLSDFLFNGLPVSRRVAAFRGEGDSAPAHVATVFERMGRCGILIFPSGTRRGDPWRLTRDKQLWKRIAVNVLASREDAGTRVHPFLGYAYRGPAGVLAAYLAFGPNATQPIFDAELLEVSVGDFRAVLPAVLDFNTIPTSDLLD